MAIETLMHNTEPLGALLGDASDIIFDNGGTSLESTDVEGALKEINSAIPNVVDNLTSTSTTDALSAYQGKMLNDNKLNIPTSLDNGSETGTSTRDFLVKLADKIKALDAGRYVFRYSYAGQWNSLVIASVITKNSDAQFMVVPMGVSKIYIAYVASGSTYYCGESPAFTTLT